MANQITSELVWKELEKEIFAVLGMVTAKGEARTVGVVYIVNEQKLYVSSEKDAWKVRHIRSNPSVSLTVAIAKRIPLMPWIKIPAATISFSGKASLLKPDEVGEDVLKALFRGLELDSNILDSTAVIAIEPIGDFITYGVGVSLMEMRYPEKARGRAMVTPLNPP